MKLRQLPKLYLRGSISNETMKYMPDDDKKEIEALVSRIANMTAMAGCKNQFISTLSNTIGGEYKTDRSTAEQEYMIAIWRAAVYLMHYTEHKFKCIACEATSYETLKGQPKQFDRRYPICPACNCVTITDCGDSEYTSGQHVPMAELQQSIISSEWKVSPKHKSPIISIKGKKKITDHQKVLNSQEQSAKYFGMFCLNYLRQILRENEIKFHDDGPRKISGQADFVAINEINSVLTQNKIPHKYNSDGGPVDGKYAITVELMMTHQLLSRQIRTLIDKYAKFGIRIHTNDTEIMVDVCKYAPIVEAEVTVPRFVCMQGNTDDKLSVYDEYHRNIKSKLTGGQAMQEDGIAQVESQDLIDTIRNSLNDNAQKVYDIMLKQGEIYDQFIEFNSGPRGVRCENPRSTHIARFLGTSQRQVKVWVRDIKVQCIAHDVGT